AGDVAVHRSAGGAVHEIVDEPSQVHRLALVHPGGPRQDVDQVDAGSDAVEVRLDAPAQVRGLVGGLRLAPGLHEQVDVVEGIADLVDDAPGETAQAVETVALDPLQTVRVDLLAHHP